MDLAALEARIRELEDERALRDLLARYSFTVDFGRDKEYVDLFTEDGAMDMTDMGMSRYTGHAELLDFVNDEAAIDLRFRSFHHAAPTAFHIDGDDATAEGYSILIALQEVGTIAVIHANASRWTFRREQGEWKIVERMVKLLGSKDALSVFVPTRR